MGRRGARARLGTTERRLIEAALARHRGNASAAARALGMSRSTLYRKLKHYAAGKGAWMA